MGNDKVDVLVIGAGASGAAFSWSLAQSGIDVMCLEQGKWLNPLTDYPTFGSDWEIHRQTDFNPNPNLRDHVIWDAQSKQKPAQTSHTGRKQSLWGYD